MKGYKVWVREATTGPTKPGEHRHIEIVTVRGVAGDFPGRVALRFAQWHGVGIERVTVQAVGELS
jgi:hypothetical protein